ncbi:MAG: FHA domain-containing protein [Lysobacterales bacterium]|nr:FHA domain-containing protein [Xanthomonadales bacterium]MCB1612629.1 FHA domain-containing protein [Xanthomonadales bacterium]MCP5474363.1 FHA domain-containing protein [Rhodanobacteraceae bacterium]
MKISFPGGERQDFQASEGVLRVGSAADNDIVLPAAKQVLPHHLELRVEPRRGITLSVSDAKASVHVNGRPVREKAILRLGDMIGAGDVRMVMRPDQDRTEKPPKAASDNETRQRHTPPRVVLRGVSGGYFGKVIPLRSKTVIGRGSDCDLVLNEPEMSRRHALIENTPEGLFLRDLSSANGTFVNGTSVRDTVLKPGDQLAFDQNRFLIEAPGYLVQMPGDEPMNAGQITQVQRPLVIPPPAARAQANEDDGENSAVDWIIMTAAVVTLLALAVLVYLEFGRAV